MRTMISDILAQAGFEIVGEAETGSQAVEKYKQLRPDLVTMDIVMPDMGGIDAVREIVKHDPDAKILMCSAMGQQALVVEAIQAGAHPATDELLQLLFRARDALERAVELSVVGRERELDVAAIVADLEQAAARMAPARPGERPVPSPAPTEPEPEAAGRLVQVTLRPEAPLKGGRAVLVLKRAQALGAVHAVTPPVTAFEADEFDGRFSFRLDATAAAEQIEAALQAAGDVAHVTVGGAEAGGPAPEPGATPGDAGAVGGGPSRHIRVDLRRLDGLMDLIGELITVRGRLNQLAAERRDPAVDDVAIQVSRLSSDLQAEILQARMTPVWQVFDRFPRLVRDVARELGKQVAFRVEGKEIELDRAILDELGDPLMHLLRNAVDHGIEPPAERRRRGKPPEGEVVPTAQRERASVTITVADDGRGVDRRKILERAQREGVVDAQADALTDEQLLRVLARPGFSTAEAVTSVSGRGEGIDVAMTRIRALGGTIEIRSELGKGTTFVLRLPVTLAIVRAIMASVGPERYALPLTYVAETVELGTVTTTMVEGREAIVLRDHVVPLVHLRRLFGVTGDRAPARAPIIVLELGDRRAGVVVDGMLGQQEIVVNGFDAPQGTLPVFVGATIMGDGVPALILDAGGLV